MVLRNVLLAALGPLLYLLMAAILAAFLAYPIFVFSGSEDIHFFRSLVSRGGQAILLVALIPLARMLRLGWVDFGGSRNAAQQWFLGFAVGAIMLTVHVMVLVKLGIREVFWPRFNLHDLLPIFAKAMAVGFLIALIEEFMFRGALLGALRRVTGAFMAVIVSSFYFAGLHFIGSQWTTDTSQVGWDTGFRIALDGFSHLLEAPPDAFLALFVAALMLGALRMSIPGSLALCMGIHAGWVFVIKSVKPLTSLNPEADLVYLVSRYDHVVGYLSSAWQGLLLIMVISGHACYRKLHALSDIRKA